MYDVENEPVSGFGGEILISKFLTAILVLDGSILAGCSKQKELLPSSPEFKSLAQ